MNNTKSSRTFRLSSLSLVLAGLLTIISFLAFFSARWFVGTYGRIGFDSILYTLSAELDGVQSGLIGSFLLKGALPAILCAALVLTFLFLRPRLRKRRCKCGKYEKDTPKYTGTILICVALSLALLAFAAFDVELVDYVIDQFYDSELYEKHYVDPDSVQITFPEEKRNLIYIMLESMETSYLSQDLGGAMEENLIPELYDLAAENTCFSNSKLDVGGFHTTAGATWTIGSMVAQTAGIPLKTPTEDVNKYGAEGEAFLPGVTSLTNILHDAGYTQMLMVGSDAKFGGRKAYFEQHGMTEVLDLYSARAGGYIPRDYFVWWGMEDQKLFSFAQQMILNLAENAEPFAFTMLTVDTHHVGGYQCELCRPSTSGETYDQSISCSSRQVAAFVDWIQNQPFYENTTVIIVGDHESMDNGYFERNVDDDYQRLMYNCFINSAATTTHVHNRKWAAIDLFPTTLAAMGCTIEGDRLGLGTNLYSNLTTLTERMGFEKFNNELAKSSDYYEVNFFE